MARRRKRARKEIVPDIDELDGIVEAITPPEVEALEALAEILGDKAEGAAESRIEVLEKIVSDQRDRVVRLRASSNVETVWREDIDYYEGRDEFNRGTELTKGQSLTGIVQTDEAIGSEDSCTEFFNITRPFVDAADARMGDILLPAGDWNFSIKPTPVPDLITALKDSTPISDPDSGEPVMQPGGDRQATVGDVVQQKMIEADKKVVKAETLIRDQLTECRFHAESRLVISDAAKIGTGVLKGPFPKRRKHVITTEDETQVHIDTTYASKRIDPFNFFPDPNCGDDIQNGSFVLERDYMTARQLRELAGAPGYRKDAVLKALKEGPGKAYFDTEGNPSDIQPTEDDRFEVWYFTGDIKILDLKALDTNVEDEDEEEENYVSGTIVLVNSTIIKGYLNPLTTGDYPYDVFPWQKVAGQVWGIGVARQGRVPQKMFLANARALQDNMALSSAPMLGLLRHAMIPSDGDWILRGGKVFFMRENSDVRSIKDAITSIEVPSMQAELTANLQLALKMMEDATGVTFLLQGQQGSAPDTVGGMQLLHQNASAFLRRVARLYDEYITERHINRYYQQLMEDGPEDAKGDMRIEALGSTALLERETQMMQNQQLLMMAQDPEFKLSKGKIGKEMLRLWNVNPGKYTMDEAEIQEQQQRQPAPPPQVQAAQIRTEGAVQMQQMKSDIDAQRISKDMDRDALYAEGVKERNQMTHEMRNKELEMKLQLAMLEYANSNEMQLTDVKTQLARDAMKLQVQKELASASATIPPVITPPTEPTGKASPGEAFQK